MTDNPYRLPRTAVPVTYALELQPDLAAATFSGEVDVELAITRPTDELVLNAIELGIVSASVDGQPATWELDEATERLVVRPGRELDAGTSTLRVEFTGTLNDKLRGWYRSTYTDAAGREQVIATTQMQATDCRRAFPCWDEPDLKAVFDITLVVEPNLLAVSNGPEASREARDGGLVAVRFERTMPMSTYLVAFVVGRLEATEPIDVDGTPMRVIHVPGKGHLTDFGLDVGAAGLRWYEGYYGIPYPSDKIDLLALPDFAAGAMENLGCITFRESLLLVDPETSTQIEQQTVADVVTHELAHMWFGDLVTMRWWNGIWLNEAFATFMEIACCDAYRPDWQRWTSFGLERSAAFETDSLASTRPVEFDVQAPDECGGMFDVLTYQKGGALLRMLEQYLGPARFRAGVNRYLRTHSYANTETGDLWDCIEEEVAADGGNEPVRRLMDSWIWQPGYPLVSARLDGDELVLAQRRFRYHDGTHDGDADGARWVVPLHVRNGGETLTVLIDGDDARVALPAPGADVVVNAGGHGFVRVAYEDALRARLAGDALTSLGTLERYGLVDDAWSAVVAGDLAAADFLAFAEGFGDERELAVWQALVIGLRGIGRLVEGEALAAFQARVRALVAPALDHLGWVPLEGEDDLPAKLRGLLVGAFAVLGDDIGAQRRARALLDGGAPVDPELTSAATTVVAATGDADDYERFLDRYRTSTNPQEQLRYMYALAEFPHAELIGRTCSLAFSNEVKTQNAPFLLNRCIANRRQGALAWGQVRDRWDEANERFPDNTIVRMIDPVKLLVGPELVADVQAFFAEHPIPQAAKTLDQVLERQRVNAALSAREGSRLAVALLA